MKKLVRFAPPHGIFTIADPRAGDVPDGADRPVRIWVTSDIIGVGCANEADGETQLVVSTSQEDVSSDIPRADTELPTPSRTVLFEQSDLAEILRVEVPDVMTRVRIWTNDPLSPDHILVVVGP